MEIAIIKKAYARMLNRVSRYDDWSRIRKIAELQELSKEAMQRLSWICYYERNGRNALFTARHFGIAPKTFWKWKKRFFEKNLSTLESQSRAPKRRREKQITPLQEQRIITLRKQFIRYGKEKLALRYAAMYRERISSWKVQKVIEAYKLYYHPSKNYRTTQKRLRAERKKRITELKLKKRVGFLLRLDSVIRHWNGARRYILTAIDTVSRFAFAHMYTSHSSRTAADFLHRLQHLTNGNIENIQTDNGSEFHKDFEKACRDFNITHYWSRVKTPKDNPHNERFNRTMQEEFIQLGNAISDPVEFNKKLTEWLIEYNFYRPHQALGYLSPMSFIQYNKRLLPKYPSSTID